MAHQAVLNKSVKASIETDRQKRSKSDLHFGNDILDKRISCCTENLSQVCLHTLSECAECRWFCLNRCGSPASLLNESSKSTHFSLQCQYLHLWLKCKTFYEASGALWQSYWPLQCTVWRRLTTPTLPSLFRLCSLRPVRAASRSSS